MTTIDQAREAVYKRFNDNWTGTPLARVVFDNEDNAGLDSGDDPWVRLSVREVAGGQETLGGVGNRKYRRRLSAFVQIFTPINAGMSKAGTLGDEARTIFEGTAFSNLDFDNAGIRDTGPDDKWQQTLVEASFALEEIK